LWRNRKRVKKLEREANFVKIESESRKQSGRIERECEGFGRSANE